MQSHCTCARRLPRWERERLQALHERLAIRVKSARSVALAAAGAGPKSRSRSKRARFAPHWERERLQAALKTGGAFRAALRFNAGDRAQAFATLPGLRTDLMIRVRLLPRRAVPVSTAL